MCDRNERGQAWQWLLDVSHRLSLELKVNKLTEEGIKRQKSIGLRLEGGWGTILHVILPNSMEVEDKNKLEK